MSAPPTGVIFYDARARPLSTTGQIQPGAYYQFYSTGTLSSANVYADGSLTTPLSQTPGTGGTTAASDGRLPVMYMNPTVTYRYQLYSSQGVLLEDVDPFIPAISSVPTQAVIGQILWPQTSAEIIAGVTPVNYVYPAGYIDRYVANTVPGLTDMSSAFSDAAKVANNLGCAVRWGATAPYLLSSPVNLTGIHGVTFNDESSGAASNSSFCSIIAGNNSGHTFDLSTSYECTFNNLSVRTKAATVPNTLFFCARNVAGSDAGTHRFNNIRVSSGSTFKWIYYGYGSEQNVFTNCIFYNSQGGSGISSHNQTNPAAFSSTFVTIASGAQSNVDHRYYGCSLFQLGNSGSINEVCIQLEASGNVSFNGGLMYCPKGLSYVNAVGGNSIWVSFRDIRGEVGGPGNQPQYGYNIATSSGTNVQWTLDNCQSDSVNELVKMATGSVMQNLNIRNGCSATSGKTLSAYTLTDSVIETMQFGTVVGQVGGSVTNNVFIGARTNITLSGIASSNQYLDNFTGFMGIDGDSFTSTSTPCTGALTTSVSYTIKLSPNGKQVTLALPATLGTTTASSNFVYGVVIPVQYRPNAALRQPVIIEDNGGTINQPGQVFINNSTGSITVFKDIVGTGNFTASATGGLPALTEITWTL